MHKNIHAQGSIRDFVAFESIITVNLCCLNIQICVPLLLCVLPHPLERQQKVNPINSEFDSDQVSLSTHLFTFIEASPRKDRKTKEAKEVRKTEEASST